MGQLKFNKEQLNPHLLSASEDKWESGLIERRIRLFLHISRSSQVISKRLTAKCLDCEHHICNHRRACEVPRDSDTEHGKCDCQIMTEQHQGEEGKELACQVSKPRHEIEENGEY
jgi:hypothetical protein